MLNIRFDKTISKVNIYNIVGQEIIAKPITTDLTQIDMSNLSKGTYLVKVSSNQLIQTIKVVKK